MTISRILLLGLTALSLAAGPVSCALFQEDMCYVPPEKHREATMLYNLTGSLALVETMLRDEGWRPCEIRQVKYELVREQHLDEPPPAPENP